MFEPRRARAASQHPPCADSRGTAGQFTPQDTSRSSRILVRWLVTSGLRSRTRVFDNLSRLEMTDSTESHVALCSPVLPEWARFSRPIRDKDERPRRASKVARRTDGRRCTRLGERSQHHLPGGSCCTKTLGASMSRARRGVPCLEHTRSISLRSRPESSASRRRAWLEHPETRRDIPASCS